MFERRFGSVEIEPGLVDGEGQHARAKLGDHLQQPVIAGRFASHDLPRPHQHREQRLQSLGATGGRYELARREIRHAASREPFGQQRAQRVVAFGMVIGEERRPLCGKRLLGRFTQSAKGERIQPRHPGGEIDQPRLIRLAHEIDQSRWRLKQKRLLHLS